MIQLRSVTLDLGVHRIFQDISCVIQPKDRVGIIGRNGAGKSTLLKVIAGRLKPTSGQISLEKGARIAYLPQEEVLSSTLLVFEEAFSAFAAIISTQARIADIDAIIAEGNCTEELLEEYGDLHARIQDFDQHTAIKQTEEVLAGLGFTATMLKKTVDELSTGWKMRLALAKLLLTDADMYLFDEPTNHLDMVTQQWFLQKLHSMKQGFLLVSHDRVYLEKSCNRILEIERGTGTYYRGNLGAYLAEKQAQLEIARATRSRQEREISQKQAVADRFRGSANRAQQAQNLLKQIERIELVDVEPPLPTVHFHFPTPPRPGSIVLTAHGITYGFQDTLLFSAISFELQRGDRVALIAANGVGKTTLINCLAGLYTPLQGRVAYGHAVQTAFFEQDQARVMSPEKTIYGEVCDACPRATEADIRRTLGSFQFSGDDVHKKIGVLSGGEKNRVAMAKVLLQQANVLILDEPTNHLDLYAKDVLAQALAAYEGTILFVSHDLDFVQRLATRIIELTPTSAYSFPGTYEEFCAYKQAQLAHQQPTAQAEKKVVHKAAKQSPIMPMPTQAENHEKRKEIAALERTIARLEKEEARESELFGVYAYGSEPYTKTLARFTEIQKKLAQAHKEWEALAEELEKSL